MISAAAATESANSSVSRSSGPPGDAQAAAQQLDEGVPGGGELDPPVRVKDAGRHHGLRPGADNRPPAPVGDDTDEYPAGAEQFLHPVYGRCRPAVSARVPQRVHWVGDQDQRTGQLSPHQRAVRPDGHRVVGRAGLRPGRGRDVGVLPADDIPQDRVHPGVPRLAVQV